MISSFVITNETSNRNLDVFFTQLWKKNDRVKLIIDATTCTNISLGKVLSMKSVLDKHRDNSRDNIDFSVVFVKNKFVGQIIRLGLFFIKTERPVFVEVASNLK